MARLLLSKRIRWTAGQFFLLDPIRIFTDRALSKKMD